MYNINSMTMKIIKKVKPKFLFRFLLLSSFLMHFNAHSQVQNNNTIYIGDEGEFYVNEEVYNFGISPAQTLTSRSALNYGVISFAANGLWANADDTHHVDGYVRYYGDSSFTAPTGDNGIYAPVKIQPSATTGVDVAYFNESPDDVGTALATGISLIFDNEYWMIKGSSTAKITLSWRTSSGVDDMLLTPSLTYLTILGYDGSEWVEIPSFYDTISFLGSNSSVTQGSISSLDFVDLSSYTAFTIGSKESATCYPVVLSSGVTKTWNGTSWSPSAPTLNDPAIINQPFTGSLSCYSLQLNADYTLNDGQLLDVADGFTGTGKVIMSTEASLLQRNSTGTAPLILMTKITNPMRRFDYSFLSSPLNNFGTFFADIKNASKTAVNGLFGTYTNSAFYNYFTDNDTGASVNVTDSNVPIGRGFGATVRPNQAPYSTSQTAGSWFTQQYPIHIKTEGVTNNGDISLPLPPSTGWVRVGNPYPSPINANKLLDAMGDDIRKTIYFWTFNTPRQNWANNSLNYNPADYATFNYTGGVAACSGCQEPTGIIATMQSVYVRKVATTPVTFSLTNCLRDLSGNEIFFKSAGENEGKFRINLIGSSNSFSQILVGYNQNGTLGYDNGYDSQRMGGAITSELNSLIEGSTSGYAIQTRALFDAADVVPLQLVNRTNENFTISLVNKDGVFNSDAVTIYLHDKVLGVYHDLSSGSYAFLHDNLSTDNDRFEIVYQTDALSIDDVKNHTAMAFIRDDYFHAQSNETIESIQIFDLAGRLVVSYKDMNDTIIEKPFQYAESVYLAKIKLANGLIVNQKVTNTNKN